MGVTRIPTLSALQTTAAGLFHQRKVARIVIPPGLPAAWRPDGVEPDDGLPAGTLDEAGGAMTGCLLAIAESGTIVLDGGELSGRRALTLLPDYHLCVVLIDQIVGLLPEAMPSLALAVARGPITFFSGPSATADIELDRVQGVHGHGRWMSSWSGRDRWRRLIRLCCIRQLAMDVCQANPAGYRF